MPSEKSLNFGIFPKLLLLLLLVSVVPSGIVWYVSYGETENSVRKSVDRQLGDAAYALNIYVDKWVEMNVRMLHQNADLPGMGDMDATGQEPILKSIVSQYDWNYLAFTVGINGKNIARSDGKGLKNYSDRSYVRQVLGGSKVGQQVLIGKTSGKPALVLASPLKNSKDITKGVLAIAMTISDISNQVARSKIGETGFAFLLDQDGKVIAHPSEEMTSTRKDLKNHPAYRAYRSGQKGAISFTDDSGKEVISRVRETEYGWLLVVQQDQKEAFLALEQAKEEAQLLLLATIISIVLLAYFISSSLTNPIHRLTAAAGEISRGRFDTPVSDVSRQDELGDLARAVERLGTSVRLAIDKL